MEGAEEARRQREQLERYLKWVKEEGGIQGPTYLPTLLLPEQQDRIRWLKDHCEGSVLEVGCCYGFILAYCGGQIGLDINERTILLARVLNPKAVFIHGDARAIPLPDGSVTTVMLPDCVEHLDWADVEKALAEAYRVAQKKVLITIPNCEYISKHTSCFKHRFLLTEAKFQELLNLMSKWSVTAGRNYYWTLINIKKR